MGKDQDSKNRSGKVKGGFEEKNGKIEDGGFDESNGSLEDSSGKRQHHERPIGFDSVMSQAKSMGSSEYPAPADGQHQSNRGQGEAMSKAKNMGGGIPSTDYGDDAIYESDLRMQAGESASKRAMKSRNPGVGEKASGYRVTSEAKKASKAKRQG